MVTCAAVAAQNSHAQESHSGADAIVGKWVAEQRSQGGIGSMWDFHSDGTLTMSIGAITDQHYTLAGDVLTLPPPTTGPDARPASLKVTLEQDKLCLKDERAANPVCLVRLEEKPAAAQSANLQQAILGNWKPVDGPAPPPDPKDTPEQQKQKDALRAAYRNAVWTFLPDGTLKLRIPFNTAHGTWDKAAQTFTVTLGARTVSGQFRIEGGKLVLSQPDGQREAQYVRDGE